MIFSGNPQELNAEAVLANPANGREFNDQGTNMVRQQQACGDVTAFHDPMLTLDQAPCLRQVVDQSLSNKRGAGEHDRTAHFQAIVGSLKGKGSCCREGVAF